MLNAVILSGGKGTRMKSEIPKVCHKILDYEMVNHVLSSVNKLEISKTIMIVGYKKDFVIDTIDKCFDVEYAEQIEQLGTAHAVMQAKKHLEKLTGDTIITFGDTPLIKPETFSQLYEYHKTENNDLTILSTDLADSTGYGRIVRNSEQSVVAIVEQKDATAQQLQIKEINSGVFCVKTELLVKYLSSITNENAQEEYYLTDLIEIFVSNALKVDAFKITDSEQLTGVNDLKALSYATNIMKKYINEKHMVNGVNLIDFQNTYIGAQVEIGQGTIIYPGSVILGNSKIGMNNIIFPNTTILDSNLGNNNQIGPMAFIREKSNIKSNCRVGNFVEIKNSTINNNTKSAHLTYLGNAELGENINVGCGVITANYDGVNKYKTVIDDNSFIGSNVNLIAPVNVGENSFIAAGTTVTKDVEKNKFVIGRTKETQKERR